jgi:hypothetical protein
MMFFKSVSYVHVNKWARNGTPLDDVNASVLSVNNNKERTMSEGSLDVDHRKKQKRG